MGPPSGCSMDSPRDPRTFPKRGRDDLGIFCLPQQVTSSCGGKLSVSSRCALCLATGSWITASSAVPGGCHFLGSRAFCAGCWSAERVEFLTRAIWPRGLRRWLQAPVRKGVGSSPTAVISGIACSGTVPAKKLSTKHPESSRYNYFLTYFACDLSCCPLPPVPGGCQDPERGVPDAGAQRTLNS